MLQQSLVVQSHVLADSVVIKAVGELNLATAAHLEGSLRETEANPLPGTLASAVMVDLCHVEYIDSAGLKVLLDARKRLSLYSRALHLRLAVGSQPARVVKMSRLDTIMTLFYV